MSKIEYQNALDELRALTRGWNAHDLVPADQEKRATELGHKIYDNGGFSAMQSAYYDLHAWNRNAAVLQHYWDGIGEWRA